MNLYRPKLGVGTKTLVALSLVFWIPVSALALLLSHLFTGVLQQEVTDRISVHLKGAVAIHEKRVELLESVLTQFAQRPDVRRAVAAQDDAGLQTLLVEFGKQHSFVSLLSAVDENQRVISRRNSSRGDVLTIGDVVPGALLDGNVRSANELVSHEMLAREDAELTNTMKEPSIVHYAVAPVRDGEHIVGALVAGFLLSADSWLGNSVYTRFGAELALFAGNPREPFLLHATTSLPRSIWAWGQVMPPELGERIQLGKPFKGILTIGESRITGAFEPVKDSRNRVIGAIGVGVPFKEMGSVVGGTITKAVGITALIGLAVALVSVFFVHHDITRPLTVLTEAMRRFGDGELATSVHLATGDQLEELGQGFNTMAAAIRQREDRFKKHNEVSKLFMSTMDMDELLDKTLRIVVTVTQSQLGVLYLWDADTERLVPRAQYGTTNELMPVEMGEGYPGRAVKDRDTLIVTGSELGPSDHVDMGFARSVPAEAAYIPLICQDGALGVLVLGSLKPFMEDEVQLFDYLADQISIALENALMHQQIHELSITDGLTGLYNRRFLNARLEQEWSRAKRHRQPLSMLLCDIDNFKSINDTWGHDRGDQVLRRIAEVFLRNVRKEDLVVRYGGEEFVVLLADTTSDEAARLATRICDEARNENYPWMDAKATLSIGVANYPDTEFHDVDELVQAADQAMYMAKTSGKDKVAVHGAEDGDGEEDSTKA